MAGIVPNAAEIDLMEEIITNILGSAVMRLFSGNITPGDSTTLATLLANEASFTGYTPAALTGWTTPTTDGSGAAVTTSTTGQFTGTSAGGTGNLYGYFVTNAAGTQLYYCERFTGAPLSQAQNVVFQVTTTFSDINRF